MPLVAIITLKTDISSKLMELSNFLTDEQKQEYEELLLAKSSKCKSTIARLTGDQSKMSDIENALKLTEKLKHNVQEAERIESENQDYDQETGQIRTIDNITLSRKLNDVTDDQIGKFNTIYNQASSLIHQSKVLVNDPNSFTPEWFSEKIETSSGKVSYNGSQLKNPEISGAIFTLSLSIQILNSQCVDGARDVTVL